MFGLLALFWVGIALTAFDVFGSDGNSGDQEPDTQPEPEPDPEPEITEFLVGDGETATGTDGADLFQLTPDPADFLNVTINGGAGNDTLELDSSDPTISPYAVSFPEIGLGDGDDLVTYTADGGTISGGDGDDTIIRSGNALSIFGEAGNDLIVHEGGPSDTDLIFGGLGDDTIDVRDSWNTSVSGDDGNDLLLLSGQGDSGAAYVILGDGGEGDDTIQYYADQPNFVGLFPDGPDLPARLTGGSGADDFEVVLTQNFADGFTQADADDQTADGPVVITDFTATEDRLIVDMTDALPNAAPTEATLVENTALGTTVMTVAFVTPDDVPVELSIQMDGTGITWDDIAFLGGTPTLVDPTPPLLEA